MIVMGFVEIELINGREWGASATAGHTPDQDRERIFCESRRKSAHDLEIIAGPAARQHSRLVSAVQSRQTRPTAQ